MIRELRRRHRRIVLGLAIVLPILLALALSARRQTPVMEKLPVSRNEVQVHP